MNLTWSEADVILNGTKFHYTRTSHGEKPALILLHGFSDSGLCWLRTARALEAEYELILPDLRGHGLSPRLRPGEVPDHAADMAAFIKALGLQGAVLGGHSMGASTSAALEARFPGLVRALVLEDPAWRAQGTTAPVTTSNWQWLVDAQARGASLEEIVTIGRQTRPGWDLMEFEPWARAKLKFDTSHIGNLGAVMDWRAAAAGIRIPTLLLTAEVEKGSIVTDAVAQEAAALSAQIKVTTIPGAGHNIRRENFPAFISAVHTFLLEHHQPQLHG
jgi:N-formylmaleamate deformylase